MTEAEIRANIAAAVTAAGATFEEIDNSRSLINGQSVDLIIFEEVGRFSNKKLGSWGVATRNGSRGITYSSSGKNGLSYAKIAAAMIEDARISAAKSEAYAEQRSREMRIWDANLDLAGIGYAYASHTDDKPVDLRLSTVALPALTIDQARAVIEAAKRFKAELAEIVR